MKKLIITENRLKEIISEEISNLIREKIEEQSKNIVIDAPSNKKPIDNSIKIFLAGTIDKDKGSEDWQHQVCDIITKTTDNKYNITIYNPRRYEFPDDDSSSVKTQIKWEHKHLDDADLIIMNLLEDSQSPISLMEIGMYANTGKMHVFCKPKFWRYDNVAMVCKKYNIPLHNTNDVDEIIKLILKQKK